MLHRAFRLNPLFTVRPFDGLSERLKERLHVLLPHSDIAAVLHAPLGTGLPSKAVSKDLARLLTDLTTPRALADLLPQGATGIDAQQQEVIVQLVLDGILEVEVEGRFLSGVEAVGSLVQARSAPACVGAEAADENATQRLSRRAIEAALASPRTEPRDLAVLLYLYNRVALCEGWRRRLPDSDSLLRFLDLRADGSWMNMSSTVVLPPPVANEARPEEAFHAYWLLWRLRPAATINGRISHKVYFSPRPDALPEVFRRVRDKACDSGAGSMKVGRLLSAVLRPDKLIVYFAEHAPALVFARRMAEEFRHVPGQGTPFTHQVDPATAVVSLGVDPSPVHMPQSSWRVYISGKLGLAIQSARRCRVDQPMEYIHRYMSLLGVDSRRWQPLPTDWSMEFHREGPDDGSVAQ
jgi:hypothetical protein